MPKLKKKGTIQSKCLDEEWKRVGTRNGEGASSKRVKDQTWTVGKG